MCVKCDDPPVRPPGFNRTLCADVLFSANKRRPRVLPDVARAHVARANEREEAGMPLLRHRRSSSRFDSRIANRAARVFVPGVAPWCGRCAKSCLSFYAVLKPVFLLPEKKQKKVVRVPVGRNTIYGLRAGSGIGLHLRCRGWKIQNCAVG